MRKKERIPTSQLVGILCMLLAFGFVAFMIFQYMYNIKPELQGRQQRLTRQRTELQVQANELKELRAEIARLTSYVDTVKSLYRQRVVWSKILADIKSIVNFDPIMNEYNNDMRYLWFRKLTGKGKQINLDGIATASSELVAIQMPEQLITGFLSYVPVSLPEKDEEIRLEESLRQAVADYDVLRRENPDLPLQGPKELTIRQRLEEIKNIKSGGVAMQPFANFTVPGSLRLIDATWTSAPRPRRSQNQVTTEIFPEQAWNFRISMELK